MHEKLFVNILQDLHRSGQSLSRIVHHPQFKDIPLDERVRLLTKYGHVIRKNAKYDSKFWSDLTTGVAGLALATPMATKFVNLGISKFDHSAAKHEAEYLGESFDSPAPTLTLDATDSILFGTGASLATKGLSGVSSARQTLKLVKNYLKTEPGATTQEDALTLIARS